jgi:hypothetical protein
MIARHWTGLCERERALDYISHLENDTFKSLLSIKGFVKASILKRDTEEGVEFLIITHWESVDAIRQFAGPDYEKAVVPPFVRDIMIKYDPVLGITKFIAPSCSPFERGMFLVIVRGWVNCHKDSKLPRSTKDSLVNLCDSVTYWRNPYVL